MSEQVTVASDWLAGCAGCHMSFLDIDERIVQLLQRVRLCSTPITDLKHPDESGVDVGILEGAVATRRPRKSPGGCAAAARRSSPWAIVPSLAACRPCATP